MTLNKKGQEVFSVKDTGRVGVSILSELIEGVKQFKMVPVSGFVDITVFTSVEDDNIWTKEGESTRADIHVHLDLKDLEKFESILNGT